MIMRKQLFFILFAVLINMVGVKVYAYDLAVKNSDGVMIYYNYINEGQDLEVTYHSSYNENETIVIPEEVIYMNRLRKVVSIGESAFKSDSYGKIVSINLPKTIITIGASAFYQSTAESINIPENVREIGREAFFYCKNLTNISIPCSVISIGRSAFSGCEGLTSVNITDLTAWCKIYFEDEGSQPLIYARHLYLNGKEVTDLVIPNSVTSIGKYAFFFCEGLTSVTIPNFVTYIGIAAFELCSALTTISIPNGIKTIEPYTFYGCTNLESVSFGDSLKVINGHSFGRDYKLTTITLPKNLETIGDCAFYESNITSIICLSENPPKFYGKDDYSSYLTFNINTLNNATLYVPIGTIDKYKSTKWKDFLFIEEGSGEDITTPIKKCGTPTISYANGKLVFSSNTEGATFQYNITDTDIRGGSENEIYLCATYNISVYAQKAGYEDSEIATATLCWIDQQPTMEGVVNDISQVPAKAVMIQSQNGVLNIQGIDNDSFISVYSISGQMVGSAKAVGNQASLATSIKKGEVAIVRIGDKSVKIVMQ